MTTGRTLPASGTSFRISTETRSSLAARLCTTEGFGGLKGPEVRLSTSAPASLVPSTQTHPTHLEAQRRDGSGYVTLRISSHSPSRYWPRRAAPSWRRFRATCGAWPYGTYLLPCTKPFFPRRVWRQLQAHRRACLRSFLPWTRSSPPWRHASSLPRGLRQQRLAAIRLPLHAVRDIARPWVDAERKSFWLISGRH